MNPSSSQQIMSWKCGEGRETAWGGRGEGRKDLPGRHIQTQVHNKIMRMYKLT